MAWLETASETFLARHDERDAPDVGRVLAQLEYTRGRLDARFPRTLGELIVVIHGSAAQLDAAQPWLPVQRRMTAAAGRRYLVGWPGEGELHVLAPRLLAQRASNVEGSLELLMLAPAALLARRYVAANHRGMPPPFGPRSFARWIRWAWLLEGAGAYFSGQTAHLRPAVGRRLREAGTPSFPPGTRDATLLGGTVFDLLAAEEGDRACVALACGPHRDGPEERAADRVRRPRRPPHGGGLAVAPGADGRGRAADAPRAARAAVTESVFAPRYRAMSIGVLMSVTIVAFQALGVGTIMPAAARELGGLEHYGWAFSAFMLASLLGTVAAGQATDRSGPVGGYVAALAAFAAGCVLAAVADHWAVLLAGRALEGAGAGALIVVTYASSSRAYPPEMYGRMLALMSSAWVLPSLAGPAVAGFVADHASWRWVFVFLLPFLPVAIALTLPGLRALPAPGAAPAPRRLGAALALAAGTGVFLAALELEAACAARRCSRPPAWPSRCRRCGRCCPPGRCAPRAGSRPASRSAGCSPSASSAATRSCRSR